LFEAHEQFKSTLPEADKEFNAIMRLAQQAQSLSSSIGISNPENPYTTVDPKVYIYILSCFIQSLGVLKFLQIAS
jgi:actinin alpha